MATRTSRKPKTSRTATAKAPKTKPAARAAGGKARGGRKAGATSTGGTSRASSGGPRGGRARRPSSSRTGQGAPRGRTIRPATSHGQDQGPKPGALTTCLWFDGDAQEAARFYTSLFPDSRVTQVVTAPGDFPSGKEGDVLTVEFTLMGQRFSGLNGGPLFKFNEAVSFVVPCRDQAEADHYTSALSAVPEAEQCGWVKDRFGLSWQIVPARLFELLGDRDQARSARVFQAMLGMKRLDLAGLERAALG